MVRQQQISITTSHEYTPSGKHDERVNAELARLGPKVLQVENLLTSLRRMTVILYNDDVK
jgi:hypothetical protein